MRHGWRAKALLQHAFSAVPGGDRLNYRFQRHVTRGYPVSDRSLAADVEVGRHHVEQFARHGAAPVTEARFLEFGAGWDLAMPLVLRTHGVASQTVLDLRPLARAELIADAARRLGFADAPQPDDDSTAAFLVRHGIDYRAPADARATALPAGSVDCVTSTNTLEHIPPADIAAILRECHRVLTPGGLLSFAVDYKDHYSYFDRTRSAYAFLRYSPRGWRLYNPDLHFQNRLRHDDYLALYEAAGFRVVDEVVDRPSDEELQALTALPLHESFRTMTLDRVAVLASRVVLAKAAA